MDGNRAGKGWWLPRFEVAGSWIGRVILLAWIAGLARFNWFARNPAPVIWQGHIVLIALAAPAVIVVGTPVFLAARALSGLFESRIAAGVIFGAGLVLSAIVAFIAAAIMVRLFAGAPPPLPYRGLWYYFIDQP